MTEPTPRPALPDHLSVDPRSPHHVPAVFEHAIGIRFNDKERNDVEEYCISEGWIKVPAGKTVDRKGQPLLFMHANDMVQTQNDFVAALSGLDKAISQLRLAEINERRQSDLIAGRAPDPRLGAAIVLIVRGRNGRDDADGLARLHEEGFVRREFLERLDDGMEGRPVAGGLAAASIDDEVGGAFGNLGIEVVHQHPQRRFGQPAPATQRTPARGTDDAGGVDAGTHARVARGWTGPR